MIMFVHDKDYNLIDIFCRNCLSYVITATIGTNQRAVLKHSTLDQRWRKRKRVRTWVHDRSGLGYGHVIFMDFEHGLEHGLGHSHDFGLGFGHKVC